MHHYILFISICSSNNTTLHHHLHFFHSMAAKEPSSLSEDTPIPKRVQYPLDSHSYKLLDEIGSGVSAIVYKAICIPMNSSLVAIKSIDLDGSRPDFDDVRREAKTLSLLSHPNILNAHCCFTVDHRLWVVMPFMAGGSFQSIITHSFPDGLTEPCIAVILRDTLNALSYLHSQGHLHRDVKAGNILVDSNGSVKLADFGVSASIYESLMSSSSSYGASSCSSCSSSLMLKDVAGTPYWMAPEVIHSHVGYSFKADIWSFGITALELAHGRPPLSHLPPSKSMILKITKRFRFSDFDMCKKGNGGKNKKFSKAFKDMVGSCLGQDPSKRPTAEKLLKHPFFKNCKGSEVLVKSVLQGLPSVEKRYREISKVVMHDATTATSSPKEEHDEEEDYDPMKQGLKQRRISGWNFNEDGLELEPVFPNDDHQKHHDDDDEAIMKEVRFGGETVIQQQHHHHDGVVGSGEAMKEPPKLCGADDVDGGCTEVVDEIGEGIVMNVKNREGMLGTLNVLKGSLEQELRQVKLLMKMIQGGGRDHDDHDHVVDSEEQMEMVHDEISRLRAELEDERNKNKRLNMEEDTPHF